MNGECTVVLTHTSTPEHPLLLIWINPFVQPCSLDSTLYSAPEGQCQTTPSTLCWLPSSPAPSSNHWRRAEPSNGDGQTTGSEPCTTNTCKGSCLLPTPGVKKRRKRMTVILNHISEHHVLKWTLGSVLCVRILKWTLGSVLCVRILSGP